MMNDFFRQKIAPQMPLHYKAVLKDVLEATCRMAVAGVRVAIRRNHKNISIRPYLSTALPSRRQFFALAVHRVFFAAPPLAVHWIIRTANVPVKRGIGGGKVRGGAGAAFRAEEARASGAAVYLFAALPTVNRLAVFLAIVGAFFRTELQVDRWKRLVAFSALSANSSNHISAL